MSILGVGKKSKVNETKLPILEQKDTIEYLLGIAVIRSRDSFQHQNLSAAAKDICVANTMSSVMCTR